MCKKQYLPVWTDGLEYDEQHLVYWITNNMERVDTRYSFLPMRMLGNFFCDRDSYYLSRAISPTYSERTEGISWCWFVSRVMPLDYYIAQKAFDTAANRFFSEYPESLEVSFGHQNYNGVYDTTFTLDFQTRLNTFQQILDEEISRIQTADEFIIYEKSLDSARKELTYKISGAINLPEDDLRDFFQCLDCRGAPYVSKKNICIDKNMVLAHYTIIPENILILGNQYIKYAQNSGNLSALFNAAKARDMKLIRKYVDDGAEINSINKDGMTVLGTYIGSVADSKKPCAIADLEEMVRIGANPAIYGAGFDEDPLSSECLCKKFKVISFLLDSGVSPHVYPCIDEPGEHMSETLLERTERWSEGEPLVDGGPDKDMKRILKMLQEYA